MNKPMDIPEGFEALFRGFQDAQKPIIPRNGMTTEELIRCSEHNARLIGAKSKQSFTKGCTI